MSPQTFASVSMLSSLLVLAPTALAQEGPPTTTCAAYALDEVIGNAGDTNGYYPTVSAGDVFTFTMAPQSPGAATAASWRIVSDGSGDPSSTLAGGGTVSSTLTYTVTAPGNMGVGFYVDSINGTARITGSCSPSGRTVAATAVPTLSEWGLILTGVMLAGIGFAALRRRA
jgi:hypothetical protein